MEWVCWSDKVFLFNHDMAVKIRITRAQLQVNFRKPGALTFSPVSPIGPGGPGFPLSPYKIKGSSYSGQLCLAHQGDAFFLKA